ncbi:MAG TPA: S53 family peptidase [Terracidiphilus sp.]|nr:S53 family peptidase [Terracidiphilus sp.]
MAVLASAAAQVPARRIAGPIDEGQAVTLTGDVPPQARPEFDLGPAASSTRMDRMVLLLKGSAAQQTALDTLVEAQQDPHSALYQRWLTPAQFGARFGVDSGDYAQVSEWLVSQGFTIEEVPAGRHLIVFSGTAAQVAQTFHTEIHRYRVNGTIHLANQDDPQIPAALAGVVGGVVSLNDFRHQSEMAVKAIMSGGLGPPEIGQSTGDARRGPAPQPGRTGASPQLTSGGNHYLYPADFATIYDLDPLYNAGTSGAGVTVAITGRSNINLSDVAAFRTNAGLAANIPSIVVDGANPGLVSGDQDEATLDVEWSGAVAPAAGIKLVAAASTQSTDGIDLASEYIVNHDLAPIMSVSYGSCEQDMGSTELAFYNGLWQQAASEGISVFVASGDAGASGCSAGADADGAGKAVNGMCSSPYSTCVGGTEFNDGSNSGAYWSTTNSAGDGSALQYIPEMVWNESGSNHGAGLWASGGGASTVYAQPAFQAGVDGISPAGGMRAVPDVALSAAAHDGYMLYENGSFWIASGTSAAAPTFAGVMALVVDGQKGAAQGCANPEFYALTNAAQSPFHPTPGGSNAVPGTQGFTASGATYNLATGLGSVDAALLAREWGSGAESSSGTDFTMTASSPGATVEAGASVSFTLSAVETDSTVRPLALTVSTSAGTTVALSSTTLAPGSPVTATVTASATAAAGPQSIAIDASDSSGSQTVEFTLTVTDPPTLSLSARSEAVSLSRGGMATLAFTAISGGTFAGQIAFSAAQLPAGVTAAWSANPTSLIAGTSSTPVTLILQASSRAVAGSFNVTVAAKGSGLTATQTVRLTVAAPSACRFSLLHSGCGMRPQGFSPVLR